MIRALVVGALVALGVLPTAGRAANLLVNGDFEALPILGAGQSDVVAGTAKMLCPNPADAGNRYPGSISGIPNWPNSWETRLNGSPDWMDGGMSRGTDILPAPVPNMQRFIWINTHNRSFSQTVPDVVTVGTTYTAMIDFATHLDITQNYKQGGEFRLYAGPMDTANPDNPAAGTVLLGSKTAGLALGTATWPTPRDVTVVDRTWTKLILTYTAKAGDPGIGKPLTVYFKNTDGTQGPSCWDNAVLTNATPPTANAGPDQTLPGSCSALTPVTLTGTVSGPYTSAEWVDDDTGAVVGVGLTATVQLPPGVYRFTFLVNADGLPASDKVVVTLTGGHAAPPVTIPLNAQLGFGAGRDVIIPGSSRSFVLEIPASDSGSGWPVGPWTRQWFTDSTAVGQNPWYRTPRIDLRNACYGVVDLSNANVSVTHRYVQDPATYDLNVAYTDAAIGLSFFDINGKRGALCNQPFDPNDPTTGGSSHWWLTWPDHRTVDPNHPDQVIYSAAVLDGAQPPPFVTYSKHLYFDGVLDPEGTQAGFDPTKIVAVEFFGTNWAGMGYDFLDLKDLSFTAVGPTVKCGDANCDGNVNNGDIDAFIEAITNSAQYALDHPGCPLANCDTNKDGSTNNGDIDSFISVITGGPGCGV